MKVWKHAGESDGSQPGKENLKETYSKLYDACYGCTDRNPHLVEELEAEFMSQFKIVYKKSNGSGRGCIARTLSVIRSDIMHGINRAAQETHGKQIRCKRTSKELAQAFEENDSRIPRRRKGPRVSSVVDLTNEESIRTESITFSHAMKPPSDEERIPNERRKRQQDVPTLSTSTTTTGTTTTGLQSEMMCMLREIQKQLKESKEQLKQSQFENRKLRQASEKQRITHESRIKQQNEEFRENQSKKLQQAIQKEVRNSQKQIKAPSLSLKGNGSSNTHEPARKKQKKQRDESEKDDGSTASLSSQSLNLLHDDDISEQKDIEAESSSKSGSRGEEEDDWIEAILRHKVEKGVVKLEVKWNHEPETSWAELSNLWQDDEDIIITYIQENKGCQRKGNKMLEFVNNKLKRRKNCDATKVAWKEWWQNH